MQMWVYTEVLAIFADSMLNLSSAYMTHGTSHRSFCRNRIVTIWFKTVAEPCFSVPPPSLIGFFTLQFELPCSVNRWYVNVLSLKLLGKQKAAPWIFLPHPLHTAVFTSELLTCFFFISGASVTPIKMVRKDKWVVTGIHLELLFCQIRASKTRFSESILTDSQSF